MLPDMRFIIKLLYVICVSFLIANFLVAQAKAANPFEQYLTHPSYQEYKAGDLITVPTAKEHFMMLTWGGVGNRVWFDAQHEEFSFIPVRNYGTIYVDVTRRTPPGDYQFIEIDADHDPSQLTNWKWIKVTNVRINHCIGFTLC